MKEKYRLVDVGRGKFSGFVEAASAQPEHVEAAVLREAKKHLRSNDIELSFIEDKLGIVSGEIVVGGFRMVGKYKRVSR